MGASKAAKLEDLDLDEWFRCIGDTPNAEILKLYAKVRYRQ